MFEHNTKVKCPLCSRGHIIAEVDWVTDTPRSQIPIGPGSRDYYRLQVTAFYCNQCQALFHHPPGKPGAGSEALEAARAKTFIEEESAAGSELPAGAIKKAKQLLSWPKGKH